MCCWWPPGETDVRLIEERSHVRVSALRRVDLAESSTTSEAIIAAIDSTNGDSLLVIVSADGVTVVPYEPV